MRKYPIILAAIAFIGLSSPASACFVNSWCSSGSDYYSNNCRYQRDSCDNRGGSGSTSSAPRRSYGAIAYSVTSGAWGYSEEYSGRSAAQNRAIKECRTSDCAIASWFYNSCGALAASGTNGPWGGAQGADEPRAKQAALARCAKEGGTNCQILFSRCSR